MQCAQATTSAPISLDDIKAPITSALDQTTQTIIDELKAQVPLIETITNYLIQRGGKRLRPTLLLLSAQIVTDQSIANISTGKSPILLAAVLELIHSATLLHDDIVDESEFRRGQKTAHMQWGNAASVLAGDFLYSRAFQILARVADIPISQQLANTTNQLAEGEMLQLVESHQQDMTLEDYWRVIYLKTATLFECACKIGAMAMEASEEQIEALTCYYHFGMAYQIIDDTLDYQNSAQTLGKDRFNDLNEGKMTLPLILAKQTADETLKTIIDQAICEQNISDQNKEMIYQHMLKENIFAQCHQYANDYIQKAQSALETLAGLLHTPNAALNSLTQLTDFILQRQY